MLLERATFGGLEPESYRAYLNEVAALHPGFEVAILDYARELMPETIVVVDGAGDDRLKAEALWRQIRDLPVAEQRRRVRGVLFKSTVLFDLLRKTSRIGNAVAVLLATAGVLYLTIYYGEFPWVALALAVSFGLYGLIRKTAPVGSLAGLTVETLLLSIPALVYLFYLDGQGAGHIFRVSLKVDLLLMGCALATAIPLLFFTSMAFWRRAGMSRSCPPMIFLPIESTLVVTASIFFKSVPRWASTSCFFLSLQ